MNNSLPLPNRKSLRLQEYDYSSCGYYFITIVVQDHICRFGQITTSEMHLNDIGKMVAACWLELPNRFKNISLDCMQVIPNHMHGVIRIEDNDVDQTDNKCVLGNIIGAFKSITTGKYIKGVRELGWPFFQKRFWQRNYYEHILRSQSDYDNISEYILENPAKWEEDKEYR